MYGFDTRQSRPVTCQLLDNLEQGLYDRDRMIQDLLGWMSEHDVAQWARTNEYIVDTEEEEEEQ